MLFISFSMKGKICSMKKVEKNPTPNLLLYSSCPSISRNVYGRYQNLKTCFICIFIYMLVFHVIAAILSTEQGHASFTFALIHSTTYNVPSL